MDTALLPFKMSFSDIRQVVASGFKLSHGKLLVYINWKSTPQIAKQGADDETDSI